MKRNITKAGLVAGAMIALVLFGMATASAEPRPTGDNRNTSADSTDGQSHLGYARDILDYHSILDYHGPQV